MAIDDHSPEGRNLTLASVGFFVFYAAGGYFDNNEVSLNVVNMHFRNYELMGWSAWVMLFWFAFRYWIETKSAVSSEVTSNMPDYLLKSRLAQDYAVRKAGPLPKGAHVWDVVKYRFNIGKPISQRYRAAVHAAALTGPDKQHLMGENKSVPIGGFSGMLVLAAAAFAIALDRPLVTRLLIPWILFVLALSSALYVSCIDPYPPPVFIEN